MTTTKILSAAAAVLAVGGGVASAVPTPHVSHQHVSPRTTAPAIIPGTGIEAGQTLPQGARLVYRDVTLGSGQKATFTLTAPSGKTVRALAAPQGGQLSFVVTNKTSYAGKRTVALRVTLRRTLQQGHGRIYALVR